MSDRKSQQEPIFFEEASIDFQENPKSIFTQTLANLIMLNEKREWDAKSKMYNVKNTYNQISICDNKVGNIMVTRQEDINLTKFDFCETSKRINPNNPSNSNLNIGKSNDLKGELLYYYIDNSEAIGVQSITLHQKNQLYTRIQLFEM